MSETARRIGRYEIVDRLAAGGMAEVFLGRLHGPFGWKRPVVIKRILPRLASDGRVVDLFLDEARTIASLRHPNLVVVHELGRDGEALFIAMEYLEGESVSSLCRRLAARDEHIDFALAAHVIAEAAAGLHAAHETRSEDGRPLEIVHRDVSPQNVFVGYAGAVHVIDFGIASSVDRVSRTAAGEIRGKLGYLAPEQLASLPCDRRADVFSLGVVLFELASGRRLFKRDTPAETLLAVLNEKVPELASFRPEAPAELQAICARAMAKNRGDRFPTAQEMRRDLLAFVRKHAEVDPRDSLSRVMNDLFPERRADKAEMLRSARKGDGLQTYPAPVDGERSADGLADVPTAAAPIARSSIPRPRRAPSSRPRRWGLPLLLGMIACAAGVSLWGGPFFRKSRADPGYTAKESSPVVVASIQTPKVPFPAGSTSPAESTARAAPTPHEDATEDAGGGPANAVPPRSTARTGTSANAPTPSAAHSSGWSPTLF